MKKTTKKTTKKASPHFNEAKSEKFKFGANKLDPIWEGDEKYFLLIDKLDIDAKWKKMLKALVSKTIKVGRRIVEIGKKIIEFVIASLKKYPRTAEVIVVGTILAMIAGTIPVLGHLLAPLMMAFVITVSGAMFMSEALQVKIQDLFGALV